MSSDFPLLAHVHHAIHRSVTLQLAVNADAPAHARALIARSMSADPRASVAALAASELVTNALLHGDLRQDDLIELRVLSERDDGVRIEVHNRAVRRVERAELAAGEHHDVGGWGLGIVDAVSESWGVDRSTENCTVVWFTL